MRDPSKALLLEWVKECWEALPYELIKKSFRACGIPVNLDGSDDGKIHCLKPGDVAVVAREAITTEMATIFSSIQDRDEEGLFAVLEEHKDKMEKNENVLRDC